MWIRRTHQGDLLQDCGVSTRFQKQRKGQAETYKKPQANIAMLEEVANTDKQQVTAYDSQKQLNFPGGYFTRDQYDQVMKMMNPTPTGSCKANAAAGMNGLRSNASDVE